MSKKKLRTLERIEIYEQQIEQWLLKGRKLPNSVWFRETDGNEQNQIVPKDFPLRCPFQKKSQDVEENTRKRWTV